MKKIVNLSLKPRISYAQNREDIILASFFPHVQKGYYIDIGASHPEYFSVTKFFYSRGWSGLNIEPNKRHSKLLIRNRPRDISLNIAVSNDMPGSVRFREYLGDGLSTISKELQEQDRFKATATDYYRDYSVQTQTLDAVFNNVRFPTVHFMKIDVAGTENDVVRSSRWEQCRPQIICINISRLHNETSKLLSGKDYAHLFHDGLNDYYYDTRHYTEPPTINYSFMYAPEITTPLWAAVISGQRQEIENLNSIIKRLEKEIEQAITDPIKLRFRTIGKISAKKLDTYIIGKLTPVTDDKYNLTARSSQVNPIQKTTLKIYRFMRTGAKKVIKKARKK